MLISNFFVDDDYQSFETHRKTNYSVNAPGSQILSDYDDAQSFETPRIKNDSVTAPNDLFFW